MKTKLSLANKTLLAMVVGGAAGLIVGPDIVALQVVGDAFIKLLQMALVPLIYISVTSAIANIGDVRKLSKVGGKTIGFFLATSLAAAFIGVIISELISPGAGLVLKDLPPVKALAENPNISKTFLEMLPSNAVQSMAQANMIQVIVFAVFSGIAIVSLKEPERVKMTEIVGTLFQFVMKILSLVIGLSPYGVFALMAVTAGKYGTQVIGPLTKFIVTIYAGIFIHLVVVLLLLYVVFTKNNPWRFFKSISPIWITSFSTCSTRATMPVSMKTCEQTLGINKDLVGFIIPLGASANMNGNALWYSVVGVFISQLVGIELAFSQYAFIILLSVLMTIGSPGIPGGIIVLTTVYLTTLGLPVEVIGLLAGIFRILDMGLTTLNGLGTVVVTSIMGYLEKQEEKAIEGEQVIEV